MAKLPSTSGKKVIKALGKIGFVVVRQKGSHVILQRESNLVTVPLHDPIKKSTLNAILKQADVSLEELLEHL
ncbi:type II toxin-antitoxin system HicA family toxin [Methanosarcina sp.]|uniref:type II toxin-antitoxin system HicA family toxin n=1 Tax=Methanosarcina sp. TaxID=2213 RepID=UPI002C7ECA51|nr:type II toxin-antitoxin system HicA family toxin [Methanosarcina sp.]HOW14998.1 type II toxin-antitoxin system HicA family toxin [Methanosarcina sp.]